MLNDALKSAIQSLNIDNLDINASNHDVKFLVDRYMPHGSGFHVFSTEGLALLRECYALAAREKVNEQVIEVLSDAKFYSGALTEEDLVFLSENLKEVVDYLLTEYDTRMTLPLGFIQPQEVTDFMCKIAAFPKDVTVFNPFAGADSYAMVLPNEVVGEEISAYSWALGQIRLFSLGLTPRTNFKLGDSFESMSELKKFPAIISSPVYLMEKGKRIEDIVSLLYNKLEDGGTLVCLVTDEFLTSQVESAFNMRKKLVEDRAIKAVISIPNNIFAGSSVRQTALVLTKGVACKEIVMANASDYTRFTQSVYRQTTFDWEQFISDMKDDLEDYYDVGDEALEGSIAIPFSYERIVDFDLAPAKYLVKRPVEGVKLSELAIKMPEMEDREHTADFFITGSTIPSAMHYQPFIPATESSEKISTLKNRVEIKEEAVIIASVGGEIRTVYTESVIGKLAFPNSSILVLKPINGFSAKFLAAVLSIDLVADQIKAQFTGTVVPQLSKLDLSKVVVPVPESYQERERLIAEVISSEMMELESEIREAYESRKREVRSTRHAMIQTLSALSSNWEQLRMYADINGGRITLSDIIGRINPISIEKLMESIDYAISTLERQVDALRFEPSDWGKEEAIDPYTFINAYISSHATPSVRMVNKGRNNILEIPYFEEESNGVKYDHTEAAQVFYAPSKLLRRVFDNIVANAKDHGFVGSKQDHEIRFDWMPKDGNIVITVANNGVPLKNGVSCDDVLMSGFSTALNEDGGNGILHSGQGGFEIKSLMDGLGSVEVISEPNSDFPVIYKLTFEKTNFETLRLEA